MLPNESLLQVLHFGDYRTLVAAKLAARCFLRVVTKYAEELARRRIYQVDFFPTCINYIDVTTGDEEKSIHYERFNQASLAAACQELADVIGTSPIRLLKFYGNTWNMNYVGDIFEAAPPLKFAEVVDLYSPDYSTLAVNCEAFMHNFSEIKSLRLWCNWDVFRRFSWKFLRQESACKLRVVSVFIADSDSRELAVTAWPRTPTENEDRSVEELVRCCATLPRLQSGDALELDFSETYIPGAVGLRIIELLKNSGCGLTFRMRTLRDGGELVLDERDYAVEVIDTATRYTSEKNGIVVEVKDCLITIQSTAEVPRKKPRMSEV